MMEVPALPKGESPKAAEALDFIKRWRPLPTSGGGPGNSKTAEAHAPKRRCLGVCKAAKAPTTSAGDPSAKALALPKGQRYLAKAEDIVAIRKRAAALSPKRRGPMRHGFTKQPRPLPH